MVTLLEQLERGEVVSPAACREIVAILKRQQLKEGTARHLEDALKGLFAEPKTNDWDELSGATPVPRWESVGDLAVFRRTASTCLQ